MYVCMNECMHVFCRYRRISSCVIDPFYHRNLFSSLSFYLSRLLPMICVLLQHYEKALLPINESLSLAQSLSSQSHEFIFEILKSLLDGEHWRRIEIRI